MSSLLFSMKLPYERHLKTLVTGKLTLEVDGISQTFTATSGCIGYQYHGAQAIKGKGAIPTQRMVGIPSYSVSTNKLWLPHVKGIEGSFFPIAPFQVKLSSGIRGDFGIHFDANVPGSAGCIVLPKQHDWTAFLEAMKWLARSGIKAVPLQVSYF